MADKLKKKRFSLRKKLMLIFGLLILGGSSVEVFLAVLIARRAVTEKIEAHLVDKAADVAEIIDARIQATLQFVEGVARMPSLRDPSLSYHQKAQSLVHEAYLCRRPGLVFRRFIGKKLCCRAQYIPRFKYDADYLCRSHYRR